MLQQVFEMDKTPQVVYFFKFQVLCWKFEVADNGRKEDNSLCFSNLKQREENRL
jgi:hypothetical protein